MINKVILVGRLGRDPEVKSTPSGTTVTKFSVATDEKFTDRNGEKQERTEWHNCEAWGKLGDICGQYLRKGKLVYIEGRINTDKWEKDGQTKYFTKVKVNEMKMLDRGGDAGGSSGGGSGYDGPSDSSDSGPEDDDVPF
jgi:single-strand DNA-binding protein